MKITQRETMLGLFTLTAFLYGGSLIAVKPKLDRWKELKRLQAEVNVQIQQDRQILAEKSAWMKELGELTKVLPAQPAGTKTDVHWLSKMDGLATAHGLTISKRQAGDEKQNGDVYELPIECKEWEGSLDALTHFLFELESGGAMFDVRQLMIKPKSKGVLRGRFTLYCAYTREAAASK